uniref:Uncharacterized protein n=1 Tax=Melopsittacus undulatus TaxID=13146 RepID=A0A8V5GP27_MELUD
TEETFPAGPDKVTDQRPPTPPTTGAAPRRPLTLAEVEPGSENERLGVARDSMLCNPRILKVRHTVPPHRPRSLSRYHLHLSGAPEDGEGSRSRGQPLAPQMPRDYIAMNRGALKAGYTTAREYNLYYKAKDIRCKDDEHSRFMKCPPQLPGLEPFKNMFNANPST